MAVTEDKREIIRKEKEKEKRTYLVTEWEGSGGRWCCSETGEMSGDFG